VAVQREDRFNPCLRRSTSFERVWWLLCRPSSNVTRPPSSPRSIGCGKISSRESATLRAEFNEQVRSLAQIVEQMQARSAAMLDKVAGGDRSADHRVREPLRSGASTTCGVGHRRARAGCSPADACSRCVTTRRSLAYRVTSLDTNLRKFDEQAARMVTYFNDVTQQMEAASAGARRHGEDRCREPADSILKRLVEENDSTIRGSRTTWASRSPQKLNDAEDRFNSRLLAAENRMKEESARRSPRSTST
jgi:hypothetical protein